MDEEKYPRLRKDKDKIQDNLPISPPKTPPQMSAYLSGRDVSQEDLNAEAKWNREIIDRRKKQSHLDLVEGFVIDILQETMPGILRYHFPTKNLDMHGEEARKATFNVCKQKIEEILFEIERRNTATEILNEAVFGDDVKKRVESGADVGIRFNNPSGVAFKMIRYCEYPEYTELTKEKLAVLDESIAFHQKIVEIYEAELARRRSEGKVDVMLSEMRALCNKAKPVKKRVIAANAKAAKCFEYGKPDAATCKTLLDGISELEELERQFNILVRDTSYWTDEALNLPTFPILSGEDTNKRNSVEFLWKYHMQEFS